MRHLHRINELQSKDTAFMPGSLVSCVVSDKWHSDLLLQCSTPGAPCPVAPCSATGQGVVGGTPHAAPPCTPIDAQSAHHGDSIIRKLRVAHWVFPWDEATTDSEIYHNRSAKEFQAHYFGTFDEPEPSVNFLDPKTLDTHDAL